MCAICVIKPCQTFIVRFQKLAAAFFLRQIPRKHKRRRNRRRMHLFPWMSQGRRCIFHRRNSQICHECLKVGGVLSSTLFTVSHLLMDWLKGIDVFVADYGGAYVCGGFVLEKMLQLIFAMKRQWKRVLFTRQNYFWNTI